MISGAIIIAEMQHLSDLLQRKNNDATRNGNDASYFHRKLGTLGDVYKRQHLTCEVQLAVPQT